jgi:hypothetical protein
LQDVEPDYLTKELLSKLDDTCVIELAMLLNKKHKTEPMLARAELTNEPITDEVQEVIDSYSIGGEVVGDIIEKAKSDGLVTQNRQWYDFAEVVGSGKVSSKEKAVEILLAYYNK